MNVLYVIRPDFEEVKKGRILLFVSGSRSLESIRLFEWLTQSVNWPCKMLHFFLNKTIFGHSVFMSTRPIIHL
jgi:hypothetical protein